MPVHVAPRHDDDGLPMTDRALRARVLELVDAGEVGLVELERRLVAGDVTPRRFDLAVRRLVLDRELERYWRSAERDRFAVALRRA